MASHWRERVRGLRHWLTRQSEGEAFEATPTASAVPLAINLGIDFGTSFTKVGFRDVGTEEMGLVTFGATTAQNAMIPSVVKISRTGALSLDVPDSAASGQTVIRYLKMRLADVALPDRPVTMPDRIPEICGFDFNSKEGICALSSWFLATVIVRAQQWVLQHEAMRAKGRTLQWSANIGVPVEYYDSPAIGVFREVLAVAWAWANADEIPAQVETLIARYKEAVDRANTEATDCHAMAEIAAAVQSFVTSRQAVPGIYVYFDIGGGTLDGVAFNFVNWAGERAINFYSGRVASLGMAAIAGRCTGARVEEIERVLMNGEMSPVQQKLLGPLWKEVQLLVANVVFTAKKKDVRNWQREAVQQTSQFRKRMWRLDPEDMEPLVVFVGGGGADSKWYQSAIESTHGDFNHLNADIPPYKLTAVERPSDVNMNGLDAAEFGRFAVACGLSVPFGEGPDIGLPSEFSEAERPRARQLTNVVDYSDSKDVYD